VIAACALALLLAAPLLAQPPLLSSSQPGAFGVRYLANRAVVTYTVEKPGDAQADQFMLRVRLPERVQWGFLDRDPIPGNEINWDNGQAVVRVPFGSSRLHLGWAGEAALPPESAQVPVYVGDRQVGTMTARFDLEGMHASGEVPEVGPGITDVRVEFAQRMLPDQVSLSVGDDSVRRWKYETTTLRARRPVQISPSPRISLRVEAPNLSGSPVERVVFGQVEPPAQVVRIDDADRPEGVLVEAEDYTDVTGTEPQVDPGSHHDTHGGSCIYSFLGDGTTLEWEFEVPEDGLYDLYLRISCGDVGAWRSISVDGETPAGLGLVELPGTGGWGHADGEWWIVRVTGADDQPASLNLEAGEHTLEMTGLLTTHLNIDYLLLVPSE
jgi:hypothetical protein